MRFTGRSLAIQRGLSDVGPSPRVWELRDWLALAVVVLAGGLLRLARITRPDAFVFDEIYYAQNACLYIHGAAEVCGPSPYTGGHPPLGEWLIGAGIAAFGYNAFGWRIAAVVAGALGIALLYLLARRLLGSTLGAAIAAGLLAIDFLHFVHSRVAMLDVFITLFSLAAVTFAVLDRDHALARAAGSRNLVLGRPWRLAAGAAAGAAIACKWSGALALIGVILLVVTWELARRRADGRGAWVLRALREEGLSVVVGLMVIPATVYAASYIGRAPGEVLALPWAAGSWLRGVVDQNLLMFHVHVTIAVHHPYESPAWAWLLVKQPVAYYFDTFQGNYQEILALGNPLVWWSSVPALGYVAYRAVRNRTVFGPEPVILIAFLISLVPWLLVMGVRNAVFLFYLLPTVPFMCLALAYVAVQLVRHWPGRVVAGLFLVASLAAFAFYYPVLAAVPLPPSAWETRILFNDCAVDGGFRAVPDDETSIGPPPAGWCWR